MQDNKPIIIWLLSVAALVFTMIIVGAITRLTESGLSMVEWRPLIGALPPLNDAEWNRVFELYQQTPEFQKKNFWMELSEFKAIFFWEWFHRLLGRLIGVAFALPLLFFWIRGMIPQGYKLKFLGMLILGGLQGLMGWYMVKSGLVDVPAVSHYRLAAHLSLALLIVCLLLWLGLSLIKQNTPYLKPKTDTCKPLFFHALIILGIVTITVFWGAFTAGLDAGLVYNDSFPKMGGRWIPPTLNQVSPFWLNMFENPVGVQFTHRWLGIITVFAVLSLWMHMLRRGHAHWYTQGLAIIVLAQMGLGISTLLTGVNIVLATLHQAGAVCLLSLMIINIRYLKP